VKKLYVYAISPIDTWHGWHPLKQNIPSAPDDHDWISWKVLNEQLGIAKVGACELDWEGDVRRADGGPYWTVIPALDFSSHIVVAWKRDSDGTTLVGSPAPMPWLGEGVVCETMVKTSKSRAS
jgi:hypothetical protein